VRALGEARRRRTTRPHATGARAACGRGVPRSWRPRCR